MPDFYQHSRLPTLHHLSECSSTPREAELAEWSRERPMALLLPALAIEFGQDALRSILTAISTVPYVSEVILTVNKANAVQIEQAQHMVASLLGEKPFTLLWNDGPELQAIHREFTALSAPPYVDGKGTNIWTGIAYLLARGEHAVVASHDTDILSYERGMLWRLCYPVAHPGLSYQFAKGYYGRVGERLYGRMTRLMISPLLQTFAEVAGTSPLLDHLSSFRYPLSGEFCATLDTLGQVSIPAGWGLEMALLCETHRKLDPARICQVDLGFNFVHRHRTVSNAPAQAAAAEGLIDSAIEVSRTLAGNITQGMSENEASALLRTVQQRYAHIARQWVPRYEHDAIFNGLRYDAEDELRAVDVFAEALSQAFNAPPTDAHVQSCLERPTCASMLDAAPGLRQALLDAAIR